MKDLILFGVQGCGKGTQGRILAEENGYKVFETGKELRALIADENSELGKKIKEIVEGGNLVSDEVVIEIVENYVKDVPAEPASASSELRTGRQAIIFDGLPRKVSQKDLFEEVMEKYDRKPLAVMIHISDETALARLGNRWMSKSTGKIFAGKEAALAECAEEDVYQRSDDTPEAIKTRLANYHQETQPVIDWYTEEGRMVEVNGEQGLEEVTKELLEKLGV